MNHYLFEDKDTGEFFIVCACSVYEAVGMNEDADIRGTLLGEMSEEEAEASGLDEY